METRVLIVRYLDCLYLMQILLPNSRLCTVMKVFEIEKFLKDISLAVEHALFFYFVGLLRVGSL